MMVMKYKTLAVAGILVAAGLTAAAQERFQVQRDNGFEVVEQRGFGVVAVDPVDMGGTVLDAPFSADAVTEVTQVLADGNRIEQKRSSSIARNGAGHTRREQNGVAFGTFMAQGPQTMVTITDPTSGVHLTLNYDQKIAYRMKPSRTRLIGPPPGDATVTYGAVGAMATRGNDIILSTQGFEAGRRVGPAPMPGGPPPDMFELAVDGPTTITATASAVAAMPLQADDNVRIETLDPKEIEGVRAEGTRTTRTIPAGAMGNQLPIEIVNERWFSPELKVVLMTRRYDPRFGETVYRLTNLVRGEPSADLFKVPADFKTEDVRP
jgi:hypothetical protein